MTKNILNNSFVLPIRVLLSFLFLYATFSKGLAMDKFIVQLEESPLIPLSLLKLSAYGIILIEIGIVILLASNKYYRIGLYASYSIMLFFSLYIFYLLSFAPKIPCACGGILGKLNFRVHLIFNVSITILALVTIIWIEKKELKKVLIE